MVHRKTLHRNFPIHTTPPVYVTLEGKNGFTSPFYNTGTLKFKTQPTNAFFAIVNQMFGGSLQLPSTVERAVIRKSLSTVQTRKRCSAVVGS